MRTVRPYDGIFAGASQTEDYVHPYEFKLRGAELDVPCTPTADPLPAANDLVGVSASVGTVERVLDITNTAADTTRFRHHDRVDTTRRLMFSAERLWQALTFAVGRGAETVVIDAARVDDNSGVLVYALGLAVGMLGNVSTESPRIVVINQAGTQFEQMAGTTARRMRDMVDDVGPDLSLVALCELATVLAQSV